MSKRFFTSPRKLSLCFLAIGVVACLAWLILFLGRHPRTDGNLSGHLIATTQASGEQKDVMPGLEGDEAVKYLEARGESESLMTALANARFGMSWHERSPFGDDRGGYLALSHDQNLNAWFDDEGVTVRPTGNAEDRKNSWRFGMKLKAYGYGAQLPAAPPVVGREAKGNRVEYRRSSSGTENRGFGFYESSLPQLTIGNRQSAITEWYENRAAGIEQGFTINERPVRSAGVSAEEPLRLVVSLSGNLRARATDGGQEVKLVNESGEGTLTYGKLVARDREARSVAAYMETTAEGNEIVLVVEDQQAVYPIVIDPIIANEEAKLTAAVFFEGGANFGFAVAISGNLAVVGAPLQDTSVSIADTGRVFVFIRSGSEWVLDQNYIFASLISPSLRCGYSVAVEGNRIVYGCPGVANTVGGVVILQRETIYTRNVLDAPITRVGDRYGASVAISGNKVIVGSPFHDGSASQDTNEGAAVLFELNSELTVIAATQFTSGAAGLANNQFGTDVDIDGDTFVVGEPAADTLTGGLPIFNKGSAWVFSRDSQGNYQRQLIEASDFAAQDFFGFSVAVSGDTIAVGAPFDDNAKGTNAGAVYTFVRGITGSWTQQSELIASDGFSNDEFSFLGLALEGNTLVVGSHFADGPNFPFNPNDNRGEAYVFLRSDTNWTEESRFRPSGLAGFEGAEFGISVAISGDTVIVGAQSDDVLGRPDAGSAYVYRLSCVALVRPKTSFRLEVLEIPASSGEDVCEGAEVVLSASSADGSSYVGASYQWRKNGTNIPGATVSEYRIVAASFDAGTYDVVVSNSCSSQTSLPFLLGVFAGCAIDPPSQNFSHRGGNGTINVTACPTCLWGLRTSAYYATVSGSATRGNGQVIYSITPNGLIAIFNGEIRLVGKTFNFQMAAAPNATVNNTGDDGFGSLRDQINRLNGLPGDYVLTFDLPGPGPHFIDLRTELPALTSNISIINDRAGDEPVTVRRSTAAGTPEFRIFTIRGTNTVVTIAGLTISNGRSGHGGGILNDIARVTMRNCALSNNSATILGGGISNIGSLSLSSCTINGNSAIDGGGMFNGGNVNLSNCTLSGNAASGLGGGIINGGSVNLTNCTLSGNSASSAGGGIYNGFFPSIASLSLTNCTLVGNIAPNGGGILNNGGTMEVGNAIFKRGSTGGNISNMGTFTSRGHNLSDDDAGGNAGVGPGGWLNASGDRRNTDPQLRPLDGYGGPTLTHALFANSPAIDGGDDTVLGPPWNLSTDQRGFSRRVGAHVDIGAFEFGATQVPVSAIQFSPVIYNGGESDGRIDVNVARTGDSSGTAAVSYSTSDFSDGFDPNNCSNANHIAASSRCDYILALGTIRFLAGETSKTISLLVIDDSYPESPEIFSISLSNPNGAILGFSNVATIRITDNDAVTGPNPLDQPAFFVRQHFLDFLNREPDSGGLNFWTTEITSCGADIQCRDVKRVNVSAAFFLSIEFQETGYLVYRIFKSGLGNLPGKPVPVARSEFLRDTQEIGRGVIVGAAGWEQVLENNKQAYALAFVQRPEFLAAYPNTLTADQVLTQMNTNAGGVLSAAEKANLVAVLGATPSDVTRRASVLRSIAEDADLRNAEFNKAFVLMQFFGYLRRMPDESPDNNFAGFDFWLNKLNQFNGDFQQAEMVKSFLLSGEFRGRFGP